MIYLYTLNIKLLMPLIVMVDEHETSKIFKYFECRPIAVKIESSH